jgi:hypothetical protein
MVEDERSLNRKPATNRRMSACRMAPERAAAAVTRLRAGDRTCESGSAFAAVIVETARPCADALLALGRPGGLSVIEMVIGAATVRVPPGIDGSGWHASAGGHQAGGLPSRRLSGTTPRQSQLSAVFVGLRRSLVSFRRLHANERTSATKAWGLGALTYCAAELLAAFGANAARKGPL